VHEESAEKESEKEGHPYIELSNKKKKNARNDFNVFLLLDSFEHSRYRHARCHAYRWWCCSCRRRRGGEACRKD
jgi:hypothetical protein